MNAAERAEKALQLKHSGYNCCQAVAAACADLCGQAPENLNALCSGFGAGMGCMEATCGALAGAVMVAGLCRQGVGTTAVSRRLLKEFEKDCGATLCKELKGRDTGIMLCSCDDCVQNAVLGLCRVLDIN